MGCLHWHTPMRGHQLQILCCCSPVLATMVSEGMDRVACRVSITSGQKVGKRERDRQTDRQTDREQGRQTDRQADRQTEAETEAERDRDRETGRQRQRQRQGHTDTETERQRDRWRDRETETDRDRQTDRQTDRDRQRQTDRQKERQRQKETETEKQTLTSKQHASVSQGRICSDNCMCCHTEIEVADRTTISTGYSILTPGQPVPALTLKASAWQGSHWSAIFFLSHWYDSTRKNAGASGNRTPDLPLSRRTP